MVTVPRVVSGKIETAADPFEPVGALVGARASYTDQRLRSII